MSGKQQAGGRAGQAGRRGGKRGRSAGRGQARRAVGGPKGAGRAGRVVQRAAGGDGVARAVLRAALPMLKRRRSQGLGAVVAVAEGTGEDWDLACAVTDQIRSGTEGAGTPGSGGAKSRKTRGGESQARYLAGALAALGSAHRVQILVKLLEGPGTYRTLQKATRLKAGPLYHHVAQLRLAGLIAPKERDLYELTRGGRNLILVVLTLPKLIKDQRRRPAPGLVGR